jgi:hypothetical protein
MRQVTAVNSIPEHQNSASFLRLLRARSHVYAEAVRLQVAQLLLTVALPAFSAVVGLLVEQTRPYVAVLAFVVTIADVWWLDRSQRDPMAGNSRIHSRTGLRPAALR